MAHADDDNEDGDEDDELDFVSVTQLFCEVLSLNLLGPMEALQLFPYR